MVENINKIPEPEEYEDPGVLKKMKSVEKRKASKSPLKNSQKPNTDFKSPARPSTKTEKIKSKLVLTN